MPVWRADGAGDLGRLVEAAFAQAIRVQGQRQQQVVAGGGDDPGEAFAEPGGERQLVAVLERLDQAVDGEFVAEQRERAGKGGRVLEAGAAALAVRGRLAALRAARGRQRRQVGGAGGTEEGGAAVATAQQATARQQAGGNAAQGVGERLG